MRLVSIQSASFRLRCVRYRSSERGQGRDRTADLPLFSWKQPSAKVQVGSLDIGSDLRRQTMEGLLGTWGGSARWDHFGPPVGPAGTRIAPKINSCSIDRTD